MMKYFLTTVLPFFIFLFGLSTLNAQTIIPNGDFENWQNLGSDEEEPTSWSGNKTGGGYATWGPQTCNQSTDSYEGSFSVRVETKSLFGNEVNGTVTTGKIEAPSFSPADGYIRTLRSEADHNSPFVGRPDSLVGYYKYTTADGDQGKVLAILHGDADVESPDKTNTAPFIIGQAEFFTPTSNIGTWTRFSVPFIYDNSDTPQYLLSIITASAVQGNAQEGSILFVDKLEAIYNPTVSIVDVTPSSPYNVSDTQGAVVNVTYNATGSFLAGNTYTAQLSDANGNFAAPIILGSVSATASGTINGMIPANTPSGNGYRIRVVASNPSLVSDDNGTDLTINSCVPSSASITEEACDSYNSPSGMIITESGTYTDLIPNAAGCDSTITINLTITTIDATVTEMDGTITAAAPTGTYQWVDCDNANAVIAGETNATFTPTATGNYAVIITKNDCTKTSSCTNVIISGLDDNFTQAIQIFPNPADKQVELLLDATYSDLSVSLFNVNGQQLSKLQYNNTQNLQINVSDLAKGIYFLQVTANKKTASFKLVKE